MPLTVDDVEDLKSPIRVAKRLPYHAGDKGRQAAFAEGAKWALKMLGEDGENQRLMPRKDLVAHFHVRLRDLEGWNAELRARAEGIRPTVYDHVLAERNRQDRKWGGPEHDDKHSDRDWITFITKHLGMAVTWPFDEDQFRTQMVRVAALAVAAVEAVDRAKGTDRP